MTMPQMSGVKLSENLKDVRTDIPIIICTGYSSLIDEEKAKKLGIAAYIMKPIVMSDIAKTIRNVLDAENGK
jgi:FixJ family two-component response regulator